MNEPSPPSDPSLVPLCTRTLPPALRDAGLSVHADFVTPEEEQTLLQAIDALPWDSTLRRRTQHFGRRFDYVQKGVGLACSPLPACVSALVQKLLSAGVVPWPAADVADGDAIQVTVNEYLPGVGIASHVDTHGAFADGIAALTLSAGTAFRMQRVAPGHVSEAATADHAVWLPPRSLLVMAGASRYAWRHGPPFKLQSRIQDSPTATVWMPKKST